MIRHGKASDVKIEKVEMEGAKDAYIQWLIAEEHGAPNFAMRRFTVKPEGFTPYHKHPYEHEIYVLDGEGVVRIEGKDYRIEKDSFVLIPPNLMHQLVNTGDKDLIFLCLIPLKK
ncbi:MAG: hypothetical protein DRQ10_08670 [Candidatus Hydrothermota bacterium]|nr:MAG: hypothetical protein DRQ10_08670 [Candidatus Hydrothermae bacterium]